MRALIALALLLIVGCTDRRIGVASFDSDLFAFDAAVPDAKIAEPAPRDDGGGTQTATADAAVALGDAWVYRPNRPPSLHDAGADAAIDASEPIADAEIEDASIPDAMIPDAMIPDAMIPDAASCEPWTSSVVPNPAPRCTQEPPPDVGPFGNRVALTFDDGPNPATTPQILEILREENIPATFFIVGQRLAPAQNRALALEIHRDPLFRVANHSFTHPHMLTLDLPTVRRQVEQTTAAIQLAVQDPCYFPRFFRFPYSEADCARVQLVREHGFAVAGVHIDTADWCYAMADGFCSPEALSWMPDEYRHDMVAWVLSRLALNQGGIVLMHDIHAHTLAILPTLIAALRAQGVTFVALDDEAFFPLLSSEADVPAPPLCCDGQVR